MPPKKRNKPEISAGHDNKFEGCTMSRAEKFHHRERLRQKRKGYSNVGLPGSKTGLAMMVSTPKRCSCAMCGNPRKYFGSKTMQERKSDGWEDF